VYAVVLYKHEMARKQFQFDIFRWVTTSVLMIILLVLNAMGYNSNYIDLIFFVAVVVVELFAWVGSRVLYRHMFKFPVNLDTLQARWGVWVMIVIGESVIQLLHSFLALKGVYRGLKFMGVSLVLLFTLAMQYFDACQVAWYEHALTKSALAGVSWIWLHVPMTLYLFRFGVWLKILATAYSHDRVLNHSDAVTFSLSLALVSGLVTIIRITNSLPDSSISLVTHILSAESRTVLIFGVRIIVSGIQLGMGYVGITDAMTLLLVQCGLTLLTTAIDVLNDITTASEVSEEEQAKEATHLVIKSMKHFPRQWSTLQLVRKESLLEMNLMSDEGDIAHSLLSAKSHISEERAAHEEELMFTRQKSGIGVLHSAQSLININLKKLIETELVKAEHASTHFDGLLLRKNSLSKSFMRTPSFLAASIMPTLKEKHREVEYSSQMLEEVEDNFADVEDESSKRQTTTQDFNLTMTTEVVVTDRSSDRIPERSSTRTVNRSVRTACKGTPQTSFHSSGSTTHNNSCDNMAALSEKPGSTTPDKPKAKFTPKFSSEKVIPLSASSDDADYPSDKFDGFGTFTQMNHPTDASSSKFTESSAPSSAGLKLQNFGPNSELDSGRSLDPSKDDTVMSF
jgi:hypothetical protein